MFASTIPENPMKHAVSILATLVSGLAVSAVLAGDITLDSVPPVVVKTVPEAGAADVDPKLGEIKVTFSKDMKDASWSWAMHSKESFPAIDGKPKYVDKRTAVLPVKLEPGKTYAVWLNSGEKFANFKDADGRPAVPYLLVFRTKK
jgi:hypothetical protein